MEGSGTGAAEAGVVSLEAELPWWLRPQPGPASSVTRTEHRGAGGRGEGEGSSLI